MQPYLLWITLAQYRQQRIQCGFCTSFSAHDIHTMAWGRYAIGTCLVTCYREQLTVDVDICMHEAKGRDCELQISRNISAEYTQQHKYQKLLFTLYMKFYKVQAGM